MIFSNANIFTSNLDFRLGYVEVTDDKITSVNFNVVDMPESVDCKGLYLIPGLIDIHTHGCSGHDFCEGTSDSLDAITTYNLKNGITSVCATTMTLPEEHLNSIMKNISEYSNFGGSTIVGINMEGPFISKDKVGAQNPNYVLEPNYDMLVRLQERSNGLIKLVDIAPEVNEGFDFIEKSSKSVHVSLAHTNCTYDQAKLAFEKGADHLTHTFNAMPSINHRNPGPIVAAMEDNAYIEVICDGQHIDYSVIRMIFRTFDKDKICLISDSCEATGLNDGQYVLGGQQIIKKGNKVVLKEKQDTIAASATNLYECFKHAVFDANINLEDALAATTINPAKSIGIDDEYGSIEINKYANFLLIDKNLNIKYIYNLGRKVS